MADHRHALAHRSQAIQEECCGILERAWVADPGFTMPNPRKYPWQWLWDSCFHAIAWSALGDERAVRELESLLALQLPNGFVPHMGYQTSPRASLRLWHVPGRSDITQPPVYGHALRVLAGRGMAVEHLYAAAERGLLYLFEHRLDPRCGLVRIVHPWESGCDDSNRWDDFRGRLGLWRWRRRKRRLVRSIVLADDVAAGNPGFEVCSAGFNALVAFNAIELARLTGNAALQEKAANLVAAIERQWRPDARTWADVRIAGPDAPTSIRTLDALLPLLVSAAPDRVEAAFGEVFRAEAFWRPFGPAGTAVDEPSYDPGAYWRGPGWPQLTYLLMIAAERQERRHEAERLAEALTRCCVRSGYAEYWNPETGAGLGAIPQSWAALALEGAARLA